ncbi:MAG: thiamine-monophosphate kinase, partial [Hyphomicrobiaceae bacterium]
NSITPTVIGEVPGGRMVRLGAARAGDIVFVSGTIGDASLGLALHKSPSQATHWSLSPDQTETLESRYLRPMPRLPLAPAVLHHARASMDLSDGLLKDLGRMCSASLVGADIEYERLPVSAAMRAVRAAAPDAAAAALFAGDDYEILAAVPAAAADEFASESAAAGIPVTRIGQFGAAPGVRLLDAGLNPMPTTQSGWDHFGSSR